MNVLIVDDHAIVRQGLKQILLESGKVTLIGEAANGAEAMRAMREHEWSAVVLDISLPDRNGIEVLKQIRKEQPRLSCGEPGSDERRGPQQERILDGVQ